MFKWIQRYREADPHTKYFIFNWVLYSLMIIASTIYVYARIAYNIKENPPEELQQAIEKTL